jgi:hypothetical protein
VICRHERTHHQQEHDAKDDGEDSDASAGQ